MMETERISLVFQFCEPLLCILDFGKSGVGALPDLEEFFIMFDGLTRPTPLLGDLSQHVKALGINVPALNPSQRPIGDLFELLLCFLQVPAPVIGQS